MRVWILATMGLLSACETTEVSKPLGEPPALVSIAKSEQAPGIDFGLAERTVHLRAGARATPATFLAPDWDLAMPSIVVVGAPDTADSSQIVAMRALAREARAVLWIRGGPGATPEIIAAGAEELRQSREAREQALAIAGLGTSTTAVLKAAILDGKTRAILLRGSVPEYEVGSLQRLRGTVLFVRTAIGAEVATEQRFLDELTAAGVRVRVLPGFAGNRAESLRPAEADALRAATGG